MRQRSSYPQSFKAQVVLECLQPGATISGVAINHGINANVIRKWTPLFRDQLPAVGVFMPCFPVIVFLGIIPPLRLAYVGKTGWLINLDSSSYC